MRLSPKTLGAAAALVLAAVMALGAASGSAAGQGARSHSIYWGAQIGTQLTGDEPPWDMRAATKFEGITQKKLSIISFAAPFVSCDGADCSYNEFPTTPLNSARNHGSIPLYSWSSGSRPRGADQPKFQLRDVTAGRYDAYILRNALKAKAWGHPFFLRFNWEMNGFWFPWGVKGNGNRVRDYVPAWRHVHDIFASVGANNVSWVWCPNAESTRRSLPLRPLYPGDEYVDWTCMDGFNWGNSISPPAWRSFTKVFGRTYGKIRRIAPSKPMMIAETASTDRGGSKAKWIRNAFDVLPKRFPKIRAFIWFNVNDRGTRWPLERSGAALRAFRRGIDSSRYPGNRFGGLSKSPIPVP